MKAIILNGPKRCGKDTVGQALSTFLPGKTWLYKFAQPIIDHMRLTFDVSCVDGHDKDESCEELVGMSRREYAIAWSEEWIKPRFGKDWFGKQALKNLNNTPDYAVFTDGRFCDEARVIAMAVGRVSVVQICLHRPGYVFEDDSGSYWSLPNVQTLHFHNNGPKGQLHAEVLKQLVPAIRQCLAE